MYRQEGISLGLLRAASLLHRQKILENAAGIFG